MSIRDCFQKRLLLIFQFINGCHSSLETSSGIQQSMIYISEHSTSFYSSLFSLMIRTNQTNQLLWGLQWSMLIFGRLVLCLVRTDHCDPEISSGLLCNHHRWLLFQFFLRRQCGGCLRWPLCHPLRWRTHPIKKHAFIYASTVRGQDLVTKHPKNVRSSNLKRHDCHGVYYL